MSTKELTRGQRLSQNFRARAGLPERTSDAPADQLADAPVIEEPALVDEGEKKPAKKKPAKKTAAKK